MDFPFQIVQTAKMKGLDMITISDHDNLAGYFEGLRESDKLDLPLMPGVEISTLEHHLLCLNFDPNNKGFRDYIDNSRNIQIGVTKQRIDVLQEYGVPVTYEKLSKMHPRNPVGKVAIAMTMIGDEECREYLMEKHERVYVRDILKVYLQGEGIASQVEVVEPVVKWQEAINAVHKADGYAIFAHPPTLAKDPYEVLELLKVVDGIELQPKFGERNEPFRQYAEEKGLIVTYGSDYHSGVFGTGILGREKNMIDEKVFGEIKR